MAEEHAGIYLAKGADDAFYELPEARRLRLRDFLEGERIKLESTGGGRKEGLAFEWEPGYAVYWDINLKPEYRATGTKLKTSPSPTKLGTAYLIEVLEIRKLS
jgi:hypothetical protein